MAVQCLEGPEVWQAAAEGVFEIELAEAACACIDGKPAGGMVANTPEPAAFILEVTRVQRSTAVFHMMIMLIIIIIITVNINKQELQHSTVHALWQYRDGFRATVLMLNGYVAAQAYAARVGAGAGNVVACEMHLKEEQYAANGNPVPPRPAEGTFAHFGYLGRNVEEMILTGVPTYPVERCLLTTG